MTRPKKKPLFVGIVDDHSLFRNAVSGVIKNIKNSNNESLFNVLIEADNGKDFTEKLLNLSQPIDVVILDIQMPKMDGFQTLKWINNRYPEMKVLMLSMHNDPTIVTTYMKEGAAGYLTKEASREKIEIAMQSIASKGYYYDDFITDSLIATLRKINYTRDEGQNRTVLANKVLTEREREFLELLGTELSYKAIAEKMKVSPRTIDGYREELFRKFNVCSRVGLLMHGIKDGVINVMSYEYQ